jgi:hypothetical protein
MVQPWTTTIGNDNKDVCRFADDASNLRIRAGAIAKFKYHGAPRAATVFREAAASLVFITHRSRARLFSRMFICGTIATFLGREHSS